MKSQKQLLPRLLGLTSLLLGVITNTNQSVFAQLTPDDTLKVENSVVNPIDSLHNQINGGATRGTNLFHSFSEFNVDAGKSVYFANPVNIENILTRVTGGNVSNILGRLGVEGTANLFLLNPHGIIFGQNASLDIRGSFTATTANSIKFADGTQFSTQTPQNTPLLTITAPIGLQFGSNQGKIQVQAKNGLQVQPNQTLALVGGDISLEGTKLGTAGGRVELGSVAEASLVNLNSINQGFYFGYDGINNFGDIQLSDGTNIDISSINGGGEIRVNTRNLRMIEGSRITSLNLGVLSGGSMTINATDTVEVIGTGEFEQAFGQVINPAANPADRRNGFFAISVGTGSGGNFEMNTDKLILKNGAFILISAFGKGKGGNVDVNASGSVEVNDSLLATGNLAGSSGDAGNIKLNTQNLILENRGLIGTTSFGSGKAGDITINAVDSIDMTGGETFSQIIIGAGINTSISSYTFGASDAGDFEINTRQLNLRNKAQIGSATFAGGNGGNLTVNAHSIKLIGTNPVRDVLLQTAIATSADRGSLGNSGNLTINTHSLEILDGGSVGAGTLSSGNAGNLTVNASDIQIIGTNSISFSSGLYANSTLLATGAAGDIKISTNTLNIQDSGVITTTTANGKSGNINVNANTFTAIGGGQILTTTSGSAKAGNIIMQVRDNITLDGEKTGLFANTAPGSTGDSGSIDIDPKIFIIRNGAGIGVNSQGSGKGGNISLQAGTLTLDNKAFITAETISNQGGEINLQIQDLLWLRHGSNITATAGTAGAGGDGGNININAPFIIGFASENSDITANAFQGNGGNINITTNTIFGLKFNPQLTEFSDITASSQFGLSGQVTINRLDVDPASGLASLPVNLLNASNQISQRCKRGRLARQLNNFSIVGRGGLPSNPHNLLTDTTPLVDLVDVSSDNEKNKQDITPVVLNNQSVNITNRVIQQAQGWTISDDGKVILTAEAPNAILQSSVLNKPGCQVSTTR
ncbi:S-layer family protein [Anabaena sp. UHCC 0204]|uniref:two-partner secretion domain-containing protein n=1 Tax=Anabaena sp. UHCC 0204 TaxID=2590009 RepID=UPI001446BFFE|nr:S-layer family protein [Anabaena sp. UHCC 0204]